MDPKLLLNMTALMHILTRSPALTLTIILLLTFGAGRLLSVNPADHAHNATAAHASRL
jgi:hypothetical protein